ncbi:hypothetical protein Hanom_Chr08g00700091 [Helianthus anomalus]
MKALTTNNEKTNALLMTISDPKHTVISQKSTVRLTLRYAQSKHPYNTNEKPLNYVT